MPQLEVYPAWGVPQPGACWGSAATLTAVTQARAAPGSPPRLSVLGKEEGTEVISGHREVWAILEEENPVSKSLRGWDPA